jgi:hypothetical protein
VSSPECHPRRSAVQVTRSNELHKHKHWTEPRGLVRVDGMSDQSFLEDQRLSDRRFLRFAGYPHQTIYAHYLYTRTWSDPSMKTYRLIRTVAVGRGRGPCGMLTVRRRTLNGVKPRLGSWEIRFDGHRRYRPMPLLKVYGNTRCLLVYARWRANGGMCGLQ